MRALALIPLVDLADLAALLGIRPWRPDDGDDLAVLEARLARRTALAEHVPDGPPPTGRPRPAPAAVTAGAPWWA